MLVVETSGKYGRDELKRALTEARADPRFAPETRLLFDGRQSEVDISTADVQWRIQFVTALRAMGFASRCVIVVRNDTATYGMGRMLSMRVEDSGFELHVTRDFDEGMLWLVRPSPG